LRGLEISHVTSGGDQLRGFLRAPDVPGNRAIGTVDIAGDGFGGAGHRAIGGAGTVESARPLHLIHGGASSS